MHQWFPDMLDWPATAIAATIPAAKIIFP